MAVVSWSYAETKTHYAEQAKQDATQLTERLPAILREIGLPDETLARYTLHEGVFVAGQPIANQWRSLFAQAVIKLEHVEAGSTGIAEVPMKG
jgi:adenylate cyclase